MPIKKDDRLTDEVVARGLVRLHVFGVHGCTTSALVLKLRVLKLSASTLSTSEQLEAAEWVGGASEIFGSIQIFQGLFFHQFAIGEKLAALAKGGRRQQRH